MNNLNQIIYTDFSKEAAPADPDFYNTFPLTRENFDYDRIIKFYFDTDFLSEDSLDITKVNNILNSSECFYNINMNLENQIIDCTFIKYYPLSEEQKGIDPETEREYEKLVGQ